MIWRGLTLGEVHLIEVSWAEYKEVENLTQVSCYFPATRTWRNQKEFLTSCGCWPCRSVSPGQPGHRRCSWEMGVLQGLTAFTAQSWHCCMVAKSYFGYWRLFFFLCVCVSFLRCMPGGLFIRWWLQQPGSCRVNLSLTLFLLAGFKSHDLEGFSKPLLLSPRKPMELCLFFFNLDLKFSCEAAASTSDLFQQWCDFRGAPPVPEVTPSWWTCRKKKMHTCTQRRI